LTQLLLDLQPAQAPSLDNFVVGPNQELVSRLRTLAQADAFDALYLWGGEGSGKSHLLAAVASLALGKRPVLYLRPRPAGTDCHSPPRSQTRLAAPHGGGVGLGRPDADCFLTPGSLLIVDDVELLDDAAQIALFRIFNTARMIGLGLLIAGNEPPLELGLREDLRTRIGQALIFEVKTLDDEEKAVALRRHALERGLRIDEALVRYLLTHSRRDLPSLISVLDHLDRVTLERQRAASLPLLKEILQPSLFPGHESRPV